MKIFPVFGSNDTILDEIKKSGFGNHLLFQNKLNIIPIKIVGIGSSLANIINKEMIFCRGDTVNYSNSVFENDETESILLGTDTIYQNFIERMKSQFSHHSEIKELVNSLTELLNHLNNQVENQKTRNNKIIDYSRPVIMGILNVTGDSFYDGGNYLVAEKALEQAHKMVDEGADIIDIGGESTRPGSDPVSEAEEIRRIIPIVDKIASELNSIISVDTNKSVVAEQALEAGADIINDISAMSFDPLMADVVHKYNAIVVLMHIKGQPKDMQKNPVYDDVILELMDYFDERIGYAKDNGIKEENLILDPGIGFGKRLIDNINILSSLASFRKYGRPLLIGASRKSTIGMILGEDGKILPPEQRLFGTLGAHAAAYQNGANIFRVHDVKEHKDLLKTMHFIK